MRSNLSITLFFLFLLVRPLRSQTPSSHCFSNCGLPDTGQVDCYDLTAKSACPVAGYIYQDADFLISASSPSYTMYNPVVGSSVTLDDRTGLMWESTGSCNGAIQTWANALTCCEGSTFSGLSDWRLPNVRELLSIVDYGASTAPYINKTAFPYAISDYYWTSTTYVQSTTRAWYVYFLTGQLNYNLKTGSRLVRCVRGGP